MTTEEPEPHAAPAPAMKAARHRIAFRKISTVLAAFAAVGAVLGGLTGYWSTYRAVTNELLAPVSQKPMHSRLSIAVMPFANLSGDRSEDYFADGVVENLTIELSTHIAGLMVAGRGSAFSYKGKNVDAKQVGLNLGVR